MWEIVVSTGNRHKLAEIKEIFKKNGHDRLELVGKNNIPSLRQLNIAETGKTFYENALLKCKESYQHCITTASERFLGTLADDSGLVVPLLGGLPGVHSSRYSKEGTDQKNCEKLITELKKLQKNQIQAGKKASTNFSVPAYFYCSAVFYSNRDRKKEIVLASDGRLEGKLTISPLGRNGFGYDPLFIPKGFHFTLAQLTGEVKNTLSHRAKAFKTLNRQLDDFLSRLSVI